MRAEFKRRIDQAAEEARGRFLTRGDGQMLEYEHTRIEALRAQDARDPLNASQYPMLEAERQAYIDAGADPEPTLRDIAQQVLRNKADWLAPGAQIKRIRRSAKLRIDQAETPDQAAQIVSDAQADLAQI